MANVLFPKQKIAPCLWFNDNAEEAINFYVSVFKSAKIVTISRYGDAGPGPKGTVMSIGFQLEGEDFLALNGGPMFTFSEAISFFVSCDTQAEIDRFWEELTAGGEPGQCGWLKDKFGVSWQIAPRVLGEMLQDKDPAKANRVMLAMLPMKKLDIAALKKAYKG